MRKGKVGERIILANMTIIWGDSIQTPISLLEDKYIFYSYGFTIGWTFIGIIRAKRKILV